MQRDKSAYYTSITATAYCNCKLLDSSHEGTTYYWRSGKTLPPFVNRTVIWGSFNQQSLTLILTHLACIANGKKTCSILQQFTGRKCVTVFGAVLWRHHFHRPCLLDVRRCNVVFARVINLRNTYKRLRYSQTFGGMSSVQWRKVGRI